MHKNIIHGKSGEWQTPSFTPTAPLNRSLKSILDCAILFHLVSLFAGFVNCKRISVSCCRRGRVVWASTWPLLTRSSSLTATGTLRMTYRPWHGLTESDRRTRYVFGERRTNCCPKH